MVSKKAPLIGVALTGLGLASVYYFFVYKPNVPPYVDKPPGSNGLPSGSGCNLFLDELLVLAPSVQYLNYELIWSSETIDTILDFYNDELTGQFYWLTLSGNILFNGYNITYAAYIRGLAAAVVLIVPGLTSGYCILFATGPIWRFNAVAQELGL